MLFWTALAHAADPAPIEEVEVVPEEAPAPGDRVLDRRAIEALPVRSTEELLREMPGLHLSSHGGQGKGLQLMVRGFDAAHGSDLAVYVEGVPWNEPSNVHGQGYVDLHAVPEPLVRRLSVHKGNTRAKVGDFGLAASAELELGLEEEGLQSTFGLGTDLSSAITVAWRPEGGLPAQFALAHFDGGFGVGDGRGWTRGQLALGWAKETESHGVRVVALAHDGRFASPGLLRLDDLEAERVRFYGAYPSAGGGHSQRALVLAKAWRGGELLRSSALVWAQGRTLELSHDYTGWWQSQEHGDQRRQSHDFGEAGARFETQKLFALFDGLSEVAGGLDTRAVRFHQVDRRVDRDGEVWDVPWDAHGAYLNAAGWVEGHLRFSPRFHLVPSLRRDLVKVPVASAEGAELGEARPWSPRIYAQFGAPVGFAAHLGAGAGFRSFEARGVTRTGRQPVSQARTFEAGGAWRSPEWSFELATYATGIGNEITLDHVAGRYVLGGRSRRVGAELSVEHRPVIWLRLRSDFAVNYASFVASGAPVPYAPRLLWVGGVYVERAPWQEWTFGAGFRPWVLGPRPLTDGFMARTTGAADLTLSASRGPWAYTLDFDNPLLYRWRDGEFVFPSQWDPDSARSELPARHFTAGEPPALRLSVTRRWP